MVCVVISLQIVFITENIWSIWSSVLWSQNTMHEVVRKFESLKKTLLMLNIDVDMSYW